METKVLFSDQEGRVMAIEIQFNNQKFSLGNIYAPNEDKPEFFLENLDNLFNYGENLIMVGDFNTVINTQLDRKGSTYNNNKLSNIIKECMENLNLVDVWRDRNPRVHRFSYCRGKPRISSSRIDYALVSKGCDNYCSTVMYLPAPSTDHSTFFIAFNMEEVKRGSGYWKFNDSLLNKSKYLEEMNSLNDSKIIEYNHLDPKEKWELLKFEFANFSQNWSRAYA